MSAFQYRESKKIISWGCEFDSLLELRYAISIRDEFEFIQSRLSIYYDPSTKRPTDYIRMFTRRYTPDFLIRNKTTNEAFLIEVKPRNYSDRKQLELRQLVAENYIKWKGYDWKFKLVYGDQVKLSDDQQKEFELYRNRIRLSDYKRQWRERSLIYDTSANNFFIRPPGNKLIRFVMFGD